MSTRALYTFADADSSWNVYKHHDGYPSGAAHTIAAAIKWFAWPLPRFEANEFACAFIAAGKAHAMVDVADGKTDFNTFRQEDEKYGYFSHGGGVRMMPQGKPQEVAATNCSDIEYRYEITALGKDLHIACYSVSAWEAYSEELLFGGPFSAFQNYKESEVV